MTILGVAGSSIRRLKLAVFGGKSQFHRLVALSAVVISAGICLISPLAVAVEWRDLSEPQQTALEPFRQSWESLSPDRRERLALGADRWLQMDDKQRLTFARRFQEWQQLPGERRSRMLERLRDFRELTPVQQRRLRDNYRLLRKMTPAERQRLRARFRDLSPRDRMRALQHMKRRAAQQRTLQRRLLRDQKR